MRAVWIDTSRLEPPAPLQRVLAALQELRADEYLVMAHRHEPTPLFALIVPMGFRYRVRAGGSTPVEVVIWRFGGPEPEAGA